MKNTLKNKKLFVFDQDGTIYLGSRVFEYAIEFIKNLRKNGYKVLFFTNNASHNPDFYYEKLTRMGFEPQRSEILTAGDVTIQFLKRNREQYTVCFSAAWIPRPYEVVFPFCFQTTPDTKPNLKYLFCRNCA